MDSLVASMDDRITFNRLITYKKRWFILFILAWLNFTNGLLWISYASISDNVHSFYNVSLDTVNYLSMVFPVITIVLGLPVIWGMDRVGLRVTCIACGWLNLLSALLRFCSTDLHLAQGGRIYVAMAGQVAGALAQPLAMFSPAKLAALWFPTDQRAVATTLGALGNPLGILVGSVVPPFMVQAGPGGLMRISVALLVAALVSALLPTLGFCSSGPPAHPTGDRSAVDRHRQGPGALPTDSFRHQLRLCLSAPSFVKLTIAFGVGLGLFTALSTLFEQMFCPLGYDDKFAGICGAVLIGAGVIGSLISGVIADYTKVLARFSRFRCSDCLV